MHRGKEKERILLAMEQLARELGRPPMRSELSEVLEVSNHSALRKVFLRLERDGYVKRVGRGDYIQLKTVDNRPVSFTAHIGMPLGKGDQEDKAA